MWWVFWQHYLSATPERRRTHDALSPHSCHKRTAASPQITRAQAQHDARRATPSSLAVSAANSSEICAPHTTHGGTRSRVFRYVFSTCAAPIGYDSDNADANMHAATAFLYATTSISTPAPRAAQQTATPETTAHKTAMPALKTSKTTINEAAASNIASDQNAPQSTATHTIENAVAQRSATFTERRRRPSATEIFGDETELLLSIKGVCVEADAGWMRLTNQPDPVQQRFTQFLHPDFHHRFMDTLFKLRTGRVENPTRLRLQILHADGSNQWYHCAMRLCSTLLDADDEPMIAMALRNIAPEIETQKHLQKARLETEIALKGRSDFLAHMSHELRTPLNAILGFSQIMESQLFGKINNSKYLEYIGSIQESGQSLLGKISDLLEIANIESGRARVYEEAVPLNEWFQSVVEIYAHRAFSSHITLGVNITCPDVVLRADRLKLKQILSNLAANALQFTPPNGKITLHASLDPTGNLIVMVEDNGAGIHAPHLKKIEGALAAHDSFLECYQHGIGLGLALAKELMFCHQGMIELQSKPHKGTTVTLTFPRTRVQSATSAALEPTTLRRPTLVAVN